MKDLSSRLKASISKPFSKEGEPEQEKEEKALLEEICSMLTSAEGVSTFEFLCSGLVENLLYYLTGLEDKFEVMMDEQGEL